MQRKAGRVMKSLRPGSPGTKKWLKEYGSHLVSVRYRVNPNRNVRSTTVEIIVEEAFYDPTGYQNYQRAMSNIRQSVE